MEKCRATQVLGINIATVLLSPLFISEFAVGCPQAVLPSQLTSAFFILASHAWALIRGIDKLGGIWYRFRFQFVIGSQLEQIPHSHPYSLQYLRCTNIASCWLCSGFILMRVPLVFLRLILHQETNGSVELLSGWLAALWLQAYRAASSCKLCECNKHCCAVHDWFDSTEWLFRKKGGIRVMLELFFLFRSHGLPSFHPLWSTHSLPLQWAERIERKKEIGWGAGFWTALWNKQSHKILLPSNLSE